MSSDTVDTTKPGAAGTTGGSSIPTLPAPKAYGMYGAYLGIALIIIYCLLPFYWMIVTALRRPTDTFSIAPFPSPPSFQNFIDVFNPNNNFGVALLNSIIVAGTVTILTLIIGTFAAYALARLDFRFKNISLGIIIGCSMFPGIAMVIPLFKLFTNIGWINTYQALILPAMSFALPLAVWTLTVVLPADARRARGGRHDRRLHPGAGVPQGDHPDRRSGRVHHRDHRVRRGVERVHHRADDDQQGRVPHGHGGGHVLHRHHRAATSPWAPSRRPG